MSKEPSNGLLQKLICWLSKLNLLSFGKRSDLLLLDYNFRSNLFSLIPKMNYPVQTSGNYQCTNFHN